MSRLIVVSNRVSIPDPEGPRQAGGLAVAVDAALKRREGIWFGWSGKVSDDAATAEPRVVERRGRTVITLDLSTLDFQEYYNGFANRVLWPILHYRVDLAEFTAIELGGYLRVNALFADALSRLIRPDDVIWVHDYHLLSLAKELRARGHGNAIGFFLHIPCPPPDILLALPQHAETLGTLSDYDLVGLQTEHDAENLGRYFELQGGVAGRSRANFEWAGRRVQIGAFPVAIRTRIFARAARKAARSAAAEELRTSLGGRRLIIGVDRLDYSKGIAQRLQAFDHFLNANPASRSQVTFLQMTPKSRIEVPEYAEIDREISTLVGQDQWPSRRAVLDTDPLCQPILFSRHIGGLLPFGPGRFGDAAARRHESCRQGICRRTGSRRSGGSGAVAIRGGRGGIGRRADRQPARAGGDGRGDRNGVGNAVGRTPGSPCSDVFAPPGQRHR